MLSLSTPDSVAFWAVFQPLFEQLFAPFELRGRLSGAKSTEDQLAIWSGLWTRSSDALGFEVERRAGSHALRSWVGVASRT